MIHLTIDDDKRLWVVDKYGKLRPDTGGYLLFFGENEFEEIELSCVTNIHGNVIRHYDTSLVVMSDEERVYPVSFTLSDGALISDPIPVDAAMTSQAGEVAVYVRFVYQEEFIGRTNSVFFRVRSGVCERSDVPYTLRVIPREKPQEFSCEAGYDRVEVAAVEAEELTVVPEDARQVFLPSEKRYFSKVTVERPDLSLEDVDVTPSSQAQYITADDDHFAIRSVRVEPISSALDLQIKRVAPSAASQTVTPDSEYVGLSEVRLDPVTPAIDPNIVSENIRAGVDILGVTGEMETVVTPQEEYIPLATFYDYNGAVLGEYRAQELSALSAPPSPPAHSGLVFLGYNRSFQRMKELVCTQGVSAQAGALYTTSDGKTRLELDVNAALQSTREVSLYFNLTSASLSISWGDGASSSASGSGQSINTHTYAQDGVYTIEIECVSGFFTLGTVSGNNPIPVLGSNTARLTALEKVYMGENSGIGSAPFSRCASLKELTLSDGVRSIDSNAFLECFALKAVIAPESVTTTAGYAFSQCTGLTAAVLPDTTAIYSGYVFYNCYHLKKFCMPAEVIQIPSNMFYNCFSLEDVSLHSEVQSAADGAFSNCGSLRIIKINEGFETFMSNCFSYCTLLSRVILPSTITSLSNGCFRSCRALRLDRIKGTWHLSTEAFYECKNLERITVESGITSIPARMFAYCSLLSQIELPDTLTTISDSAFMSCKSLSKIVMPASLTAIGSSVFYDCTSLSEVDMTALSSPPTVSANTFPTNNLSVRIYVASQQIKALFEAQPSWANFIKYLRVRD